jgi:hypothetical protein
MLISGLDHSPITPKLAKTFSLYANKAQEYSFYEPLGSEEASRRASRMIRPSNAQLVSPRMRHMGLGSGLVLLPVGDSRDSALPTTKGVRRPIRAEGERRRRAFPWLE